MTKFFILLVFGITLSIETGLSAKPDFYVYGVYRALDMGNPGETAQKDFYINFGKKHGAKNGAILQVYRKAATQDQRTQSHYRDLLFPIAYMRIIHADDEASIGRLEKMLPSERSAAITPPYIQVGDFVGTALTSGSL